MPPNLGTVPPSEPPSLEDLEGEDRISAMTDWFLSNFDDPAQETPYEGEYIYIWGGPYEAREEIENAFPEATEEEIETAVDEVTSDGLFDWAPAGHRIQDLGDDDDPIQEVDQPLREQLQTLAARLAIIETWLEKVERRPEGIGHNQPPAEFRLFPDEQEIAEIRESIAEIKLELEKDDPATDADPAVVERAHGRFRRFFKLIKKIVGAGAAIFVGGYIAAAGDQAYNDPVAFQENVASVVHTIGTWAATLQLPF